MRISYYQETDTLYIDLKDAPGVDTLECAEGLVIDVDSDSNPVGIEIEQASQKVDLSHLKTKGLASMKTAYEPAMFTRHPMDVAYDPWRAPVETGFHMRVSRQERLVSADILASLFGGSSEAEEREQLLR